jgi:hypothetical protein
MKLCTPSSIYYLESNIEWLDIGLKKKTAKNQQCMKTDYLVNNRITATGKLSCDFRLFK